MTELSFADTNIILYTVGKDSEKKAVARNVLSTNPVISVQVINEAVNVCLRRFSFPPERAYAFADIIMRGTDVRAIDEATVRKSADIALRYRFSNWDSLIVAAALLADCTVLYSEDMQHGQVLEGRMTIVNPFL
ncbi:MAG: PIN domain-containing protein [Candidatus Electrothrix aestuarii]|uniref:PIN domain-containing protein n=1 Tax=Candidatus Electrothrix aestuarii TaxID=3062594 RepID=A0AAU8LQG7_9BACT|nr:PIN domain-containing protein [Candidatus Electrothrix aestuarii]